MIGLLRGWRSPFRTSALVGESGGDLPYIITLIGYLASFITPPPYILFMRLFDPHSHLLLSFLSQRGAILALNLGYTLLLLVISRFSSAWNPWRISTSAALKLRKPLNGPKTVTKPPFQNGGSKQLNCWKKRWNFPRLGRTTTPSTKKSTGWSTLGHPPLTIRNSCRPK